jgi:hypothetical protein
MSYTPTPEVLVCMCDWLKQAHNLPHHIKGKELEATTPDSHTFIFGWSDKRFAK